MHRSFQKQMPLQTGTGKGPRKHAQTFFHLDPLTHTETATLIQSLDTVLLHRKRLRAGKIFAFLVRKCSYKRKLGCTIYLMQFLTIDALFMYPAKHKSQLRLSFRTVACYACKTWTVPAHNTNCNCTEFLNSS